MHATDTDVYCFATNAEEIARAGKSSAPLRREASLQPRIENLFAELVVAALEELAAVVEGHRRARPRRHDLAVINAPVRRSPAEASSLVEQRYARAGEQTRQRRGGDRSRDASADDRHLRLRCHHRLRCHQRLRRDQCSLCGLLLRSISRTRALQ